MGRRRGVSGEFSDLLSQTVTVTVYDGLKGPKPAVHFA